MRTKCIMNWDYTLAFLAAASLNLAVINYRVPDLLFLSTGSLILESIFVCTPAAVFALLVTKTLSLRRSKQWLKFSFCSPASCFLYNLFLSVADSPR
jgi:hypothetical protein